MRDNNDCPLGDTYAGSAVSQNPQDLVEEFMFLTGQIPDQDLYETLIYEEFFEWGEATLGSEEELKELADLAYVIFGYAECMGWDLMEAIRRVNQNNVGRCVQPDGTVKRREDGKILKNPDYPKVDLSDLL